MRVKENFFHKNPFNSQPVENRLCKAGKPLSGAEDRPVPDKIIHSGDQRQQDRSGRQETGVPGFETTQVQQKDQRNGHHLESGFPFSEGPRGNHFSLPHGNHPQSVHRKLPAQDDDDDPGFHPSAPYQHHQRREDQKLVRDRIDKLSEIRYQVIFPGNIPVQQISQGGQNENNSGRDPAGVGPRTVARYADPFD